MKNFSESERKKRVFFLSYRSKARRWLRGGNRICDGARRGQVRRRERASWSEEGCPRRPLVALYRDSPVGPTEKSAAVPLLPCPLRQTTARSHRPVSTPPTSSLFTTLLLLLTLSFYQVLLVNFSDFRK